MVGHDAWPWAGRMVEVRNMAAARGGPPCERGYAQAAAAPPRRGRGRGRGLGNGRRAPWREVAFKVSKLEAS